MQTETSLMSFWRAVNAVLERNGHAVANFGEVRRAAAFHVDPEHAAQSVLCLRPTMLEIDDESSLQTLWTDLDGRWENYRDDNMTDCANAMDIEAAQAWLATVTESASFPMRLALDDSNALRAIRESIANVESYPEQGEAFNVRLI